VSHCYPDSLKLVECWTKKKSSCSYWWRVCSQSSECGDAAILMHPVHPRLSGCVVGFDELARPVHSELVTQWISHVVAMFVCYYKHTEGVLVE